MDMMIDTGWFTNSIGTVTTEYGLQPIRFTAQQRGHFAANEGMRIRSNCASGIKLDLMTDSEWIAFDYTVADQARSWLYFDIFVDGMFADTIGTECFEGRDGHFHYELAHVPDCHGKRRERRIRIYLPHLAQLSLRNFMLSAGAFAAPAPGEAGNLLCLGDSITQGMDGRHPSSTFPVLLSRFLGLNVLNHGVGGHVFDKASLDRELPYRPDWITVAYGTNDWGKVNSLWEFARNCREYLEALSQLYPNAKIAVLTPIWRADRGQARQMGTFAELGRALAEICASFPRILLVDGLHLVPHQPRFFGDGTVHPNDEGFMHMALHFLSHSRKSGWME